MQPAIYDFSANESVAQAISEALVNDLLATDIIQPSIKEQE